MKSGSDVTTRVSLQDGATTTEPPVPLATGRIQRSGCPSAEGMWRRQAFIHRRKLQSAAGIFCRFAELHNCGERRCLSQIFRQWGFSASAKNRMNQAAE
jgi:hypothetical protein